MPLKVGWLDPVRDLFEEQLTQKEKDEAYDWLEIIRTWPECCPVRRRGRYRNHRWFLAGKWDIFYRRRSDTIFIRGL